MKLTFLEVAAVPSRRRFGVVAVVFATSLLSPGRVEFRETPLAPSHNLANIHAIQLDVDGLPNALGDSGVSEASIRRSLTKQLEDSGVTVRESSWQDIPALRVRVLAPQIESQYFYVITVELEENCRIARKPKVDIPWCKAWSIYPRIGFFMTGQEEVLNNAVSDAVKQFTRAWEFDNKRPDA